MGGNQSTANQRINVFNKNLYESLSQTFQDCQLDSQQNLMVIIQNIDSSTIEDVDITQNVKIDFQCVLEQDLQNVIKDSIQSSVDAATSASTDGLQFGSSSNVNMEVEKINENITQIVDEVRNELRTKASANTTVFLSDIRKNSKIKGLKIGQESDIIAHAILNSTKMTEISRKIESAIQSDVDASVKSPFQGLTDMLATLLDSPMLWVVAGIVAVLIIFYVVYRLFLSGPSHSSSYSNAPPAGAGYRPLVSQRGPMSPASP